MQKLTELMNEGIKYDGFPKIFWIVEKPNQHSEFEDIFFSCTFEKLFNQIRGGLNENDVFGVYTDPNKAKVDAEKLMKKPIGSDFWKRVKSGKDW